MDIRDRTEIIVGLFCLCVLSGCEDRGIEKNGNNVEMMQQEEKESDTEEKRSAAVDDSDLRELAVRKFGSDMPEILYAGGDYVLWQDGSGIYKYSLEKKKVTGYGNYEDWNIGGMQGDEASGTITAADGSAVYKEAHMFADKTKYYKYDAVDNVITEIVENELPESVLDYDAIKTEEGCSGMDFYSISNGYRFQNGQESYLAIKRKQKNCYKDLLYVVKRGEQIQCYEMFG